MTATLLHDPDIDFSLRRHPQTPLFIHPLVNAVKRLGVILFVGFVLLAAVSPAIGADPLTADFKNDPNEPWHIGADQLTYDDAAEQYVGKGNVVITKQSRKLTADYVRFDRKTMNVFAAGHVIMTAGEDILTGDRMDINLETETGTIYEGSVFIKENHFFISGDTLQKLGEHTYAADTATVTACKGETPDWKITGKNVKVTLDGVGVADHATLWARSLPVLYTPFFAFPVKQERQSGFLFPQFGTSDRKGFEYSQPYFWAISDHADATVYFQHLEKRGEKLGLEFRYMLDETSQGAMMIDGFDDRKVDDGTAAASSQWGYEEDSAIRPNSDRYWFRAKSDQTLPMGFTAKLDADVVSDQDYLTEFRTGYGGFEASDAYFLKHFGRDLDDYDDPVRLNRLNLNKNWSYYALNAEARWYDDVISRRQGEANPILQKLPFVTFSASKHPLFDTPLYGDLFSEYVYYYREERDRLQRLDLYPRAYLPLTLGHYLSFEPSVGVRQTLWYEDRDGSGNSVDGDSSHARTIYDLRADTSSEIFRIFRIGGESLQAVKHTIRPQVVYDFIPDKDQSDLPSLDGVDRILETNRLTYSLTQTLTTKSIASRTVSEKSTEDADATGNEERESESTPDVYDYNELLRLKISQSYDINQANEDDPSKWTDPAHKQPFSPISAELNVSPNDYFSLKADVSRSLYKSYFDSHSVAGNLRDPRGDELFVEHRYTRNASQSIYFSCRVRITDQLQVLTDYEKNLHDEREIRTGIGFQYQRGCWSLTGNYTKEDDNRQFAFMVNLFGLGEFGQTFNLSEPIDPVEYD